MPIRPKRILVETPEFSLFVRMWGPPQQKGRTSVSSKRTTSRCRVRRPALLAPVQSRNHRAKRKLLQLIPDAAIHRSCRGGRGILSSETWEQDKRYDTKGHNMEKEIESSTLVRNRDLPASGGGGYGMRSAVSTTGKAYQSNITLNIIAQRKREPFSSGLFFASRGIVSA